MAPPSEPELAAPKPLRLKELVPSEVAAALHSNPRMIIPVGTCEHHGRHLPLGSDTIIVERLADEFSAEFAILRAPTLEYGVNAKTDLSAVGNAPLRRKTLLRELNDLVDAWETQGVNEFILLTAHGHEPHQEALTTVFTKGARLRVVDVFAVGINDLLQTELGALHGDEADTSVLLYLVPDLVRMELAQDYMIAATKERRVSHGSLTVAKDSAGLVGRPTVASAEKGERIYTRMRERIRHRIFLTPVAETP